MTPIQGPRAGHERTYNAKHAQIRSKVERCIGLLKQRFRCVSIDRKLRYKPERAAKIILSCVVLHNYLINRGFQSDDIDYVQIEDNDNTRHNIRQNGAYLNIARNVRDELAHTLHDNN